jgi:hypothetical protein
VEVDSFVGAVAVASDSKEAEAEVGCMAGSRNAVVVVLDHGTVGLDLMEDTLNPALDPDLDPVLYPCLSVLDGDSHVRDSPDAEGVEAGTLVG